MKPHAQLVYGPPGGGKTRYLLSSFWDFKTRRQIRNGRLICFGRETNPSLFEHIPDGLIKRFNSPAEDPMKFMSEFRAYLVSRVSDAYKGKGLEVLAVDGFSEWNSVFLLEHPAKYGEGDKWARYNAAKDNFTSIIQMLNPDILNAFVLGTARVTAKKKESTSRAGTTIEGDPDWVDSKYFPAMDGWMRDNLAYYWSLVAFMDQDPGVIKHPVTGNTVDATIHKLYMRTSNVYFVKNVWEEEWMLAEMPTYLTNPTFDDTLNKLEGAKAKAAIALDKGAGATPISVAESK